MHDELFSINKSFFTPNTYNTVMSTSEREVNSEIKNSALLV